MAEINIVRTDQQPLTEVELVPVRRFLFGVLDGFAADDKRSWRRFWKRLVQMEPGELAACSMAFPRSGPFHRRWMAIETAVFDAQEKIDNRDVFRQWIKIGAGWTIWLPGAKGGVVPVPKSISYAKADEEEFRKFVEQALIFIRSEHFAKRLWPHLSEPQRMDMITEILAGFGE